MAKELQGDFWPQVHIRLKGHAGDIDTIQDADLDKLITQAVEGDYSRARPRTLVADITGDGGFDYTLSTVLFPGWSDEFSQIETVDYPLDTGEPERNILEDFEWREEPTATGTFVLRFTSAKPTSSEQFRVIYTGQRLFSSGSVEIPDADAR